MSCEPSILQFKSAAKLPLILQDEVAECGHAGVAMVSNFFGHDLDLHALRKMNKPSQQGVSLLTLKNLFENLGFTTRALSVPLVEIKYIQTPAILHWDMNHFVVLKQVKRNSIIIHDPAIGIRHCSIEEVSKLFTGIVLEVKKSDNFKTIKDRSKLTLFDLVKSTTGINFYISLLILLSLTIETFNLLNPLFMQYVTDDVIRSSNNNNLYSIAAVFIL